MVCNNYLAALLTLFIVTSTPASGQKVAVIEKNNYFTLADHDGLSKKPLRYKISIRELFEYKGGWLPVYNYPDDSMVAVKTSVSYLFSNHNNKPVTAIRPKQNAPWLASQLFLVKNPKAVSLNKLPLSLLEGFEYNDIIATTIVTDKKISRTKIASFKTELLREELKEKLYRALIAKQHNCYGEQDSGFRLAIRKEYIDNTVILTHDSLRLGKVNIVSGDNCFAEEGKSYGGGTLYYVIYPNNEIKLLVSNLELIDVADYDSDGKSEYIFIKSWFNNYGYIMYYDNFNQMVVNEWSYH